MSIAAVPGISEACEVEALLRESLADPGTAFGPGSLRALAGEIMEITDEDEGDC